MSAQNYRYDNASRPFNCEECKQLVPLTAPFAWNDNKRVGPKQIPARTCLNCVAKNELPNIGYNNTGSSQPIVAPFYPKEGESYHLAKIKGLEDRVAALESLLIAFEIGNITSTEYLDAKGNPKTVQYLKRPTNEFKR